MPHAHPPVTASSLLQRRQVLATVSLFAAAYAVPRLARAASATTPFEVWKDASCGCCGDWIDHMHAHGFVATVHDTGNNAVRARLGLAERLGSCHTALVGGYLIEGHVPAQDVRRLLAQKPKALGLAVPGMPVGSPGMDGAVYGTRRDPFDVLLVARDGSTQVFSSYHRKPAA